jgi:hypothetical protein
MRGGRSSAPELKHRCVNAQRSHSHPALAGWLTPMNHSQPQHFRGRFTRLPRAHFAAVARVATSLLSRQPRVINFAQHNACFVVIFPVLSRCFRLVKFRGSEAREHPNPTNGLRNLAQYLGFGKRTGANQKFALVLSTLRSIIIEALSSVPFSGSEIRRLYEENRLGASPKNARARVSS